MNMKLMVAVLFLVACNAEVARSKQKEGSRAERRSSAEGSAVEKRAPAILPTVSPSSSPGIEYADSKESQTEKTPAQQIYERPETQVAKISDVLTGHGPAFPAAIASHLYSPVPVYQPRLSSPTTYEVSQPIPAQLAYSEHKIGYQPQQNAIQYASQEYKQKLANPKQAIARLTVNYQPYPQQLLAPQPILYSQQQPQQFIQQFPVYQPQGFPQTAIQYTQVPQLYSQNQGPATFSQEQQVLRLVQTQTGITYARQEEGSEETHQRPAQRELKTGQPETIKEQETKAQPQQVYNAQPQGAVSYASFSQGAPAASYQPQYQQQQYLTQPQSQQLQQQQYQQQQQIQQYQQPQQLQPQQYQQPQQLQPQQYQQVQYQPQPQIQYQIPQFQVQQYQPAPQRQIVSKPETTNLIAVPKTNQRQISFFRQGPGIPVQQIQPQLYQPQVYQGQEPGYQPNPQFPPVQYFGKFAQSIFGQPQQQ